MSDRHTHAAVIGAEGQLLAEERVRTGKAELGKWLRELPPSAVVLETGTHARWIAQLAERCGHEVIVANPREVRLIYASTKKTDRLDAIKLARLARVDRALLAQVELRKPEEHADLAVINARDMLVRTRTGLINLVRGKVKSEGSRVAACSAEGFTCSVKEVLPAELAPALASVLEAIDDLNDRIREYDEQIEHLARTRYPEVELLRAIAGVGLLTALTFRLTISNAERFRCSRDVGCYAGLRPKQDQSGTYDPQLGISKAGNELLRRMLVTAAQYILGPFGPDCDLRRWGLKLAGRNIKAAKNRAVVGVARKLAVLMHRLWVTGEAYEPLRGNRQTPEPVAA